MKTLREKQKLLVTSIFSFSLDVFHPIKEKFYHFGHLLSVICKIIFKLDKSKICCLVRVRSINSFPNKPWFITCLQYMSFENTVGKGEIAYNEQFLLFPTVFYLFEELSAIFNKTEIVICELFQFGRV